MAIDGASAENDDAVYGVAMATITTAITGTTEHNDCDWKSPETGREKLGDEKKTRSRLQGSEMMRQWRTK